MVMGSSMFNARSSSFFGAGKRVSILSVINVVILFFFFICSVLSVEKGSFFVIFYIINEKERIKLLFVSQKSF